MAELHFEGFIKDVQYKAFLTEDLHQYSLENFNINEASTFGKIVYPDGEVAYSKWVSPKRTRSYPFERLYNIYNAPRSITVIPVLKDEGADGDLDRIQFSTFSWMNLLNVYIVLAYYDKAAKNVRERQLGRNKLTGQKFHEGAVYEQILQITQYRQSALHWNRTLIQNSLIDTYRLALESYERLSNELGVRVHDRRSQERYLAQLAHDLANFEEISLRGSRGASYREMRTTHSFEYLSDGAKAGFEITNYLGGTYFLTADEVVEDEKENLYIIQESKNSSKRFLPYLSDIKDGLFKLILYSNLDVLKLDGTPVNFRSRLKLTGRGVKGSLSMPCNPQAISEFLTLNAGNYPRGTAEIIHKLNLEASHNRRLEIQISPNI